MQIPSSLPPLSPTSIRDAYGASKTPAKVEPGTGAFGQVLDSLNQSQAEADNLVQQLAGGGDVDLHQVMIATEENDVNFRVAMAIRDKLVDAYREVMRMNV
jgi:flagellar hook-basal body complex protein FliE